MSKSLRYAALLFTLVIIPTAALITRSRLAGPDDPIQLRVDLSDRVLHVIVDEDDVIQTFGVAVGTDAHPTPTGRFRTGRIVWDPDWVPPRTEWARNLKPRAAGDPSNPMQGVKIYFREPDYYIHGTNNPESIGSAASHGCLRMHAEEAKTLAAMIAEQGSVLLEIHD